jgi:hypothetical protein
MAGRAVPSLLGFIRRKGEKGVLAVFATLFSSERDKGRDNAKEISDGKSSREASGEHIGNQTLETA